MAEDESTTWGEVCKNVGFGENLYRTCRDKVPSYTGGRMTNRAFDEVPEASSEPDFSRKLSKSALAIPPPPSADWKPPKEDFFDTINLQQWLMYGGLAAIVYWFIKSQSPAAAATLPTRTSSTPKAVTSAKAA